LSNTGFESQEKGDKECVGAEGEELWRTQKLG